MSVYSIATQLLMKVKDINGGFPEDVQEKVDVLFLMGRIKNEEYLDLCDKQGYRLHRIDENAIEFVKDEDYEAPMGDYLNPIPYEDGMEVNGGLFYTNGADIWEAIHDGVPSGFDDASIFDIIEV